MTSLAQPVSGAAARAAVLTGPRRARLESVAFPEPAPGEVCVRLEGSGVCGSNLPLWEGRPWFEYPRAPGTPGHEGWGRVAAIGEGVTGWTPGERVALLSERAFAEYDTAPADALVRLPAALDGQPVPGEALACAVNVYRRARIVPGTTVVIVGVGFLGAVIAQLAARSGAQVVAVSRRGFARDVAAAAGAVATLDGVERGRTVARVHQLIPGGAECVIEATGLQGPLDLAGELVRVRGRLVIAGYHQDGPRSVDMQLWNWRGIDVINAHEREPHVYRAGMQAAVEAVAAGALDPSPLYTHTVPLDELPRALELLHDRPDGFLKALVAA
jgi:2-desacetyl-2-hydroxyethyl bacteriochlorophyllide A dehydrogenase